MLGVPKKPRINPGTIVSNPRLHFLLTPEELGRYRAMPIEELWHVERKFDLDLERVYGPGAVSRGASLHSAFFLDWTLGGGECRCRPLPPERFEEFCRAVFKDAGVFDPRNRETRIGPQHVAEYRRVLEGIPVYLVEGGVSFPRLVEEMVGRVG